MTAAEREAWYVAKAAALAHAKALLLGAACVFVLGQAYCAGVRHQRASDAEDKAKALASQAKQQARQAARDSEARNIALKERDAMKRQLDSALVAFHRRVVVVSKPGQPIEVSLDGAPPASAIPADLAIPALQVCESASHANDKAVSADSVFISDRNQQLVTANEQVATERARASIKRGFSAGVVIGIVVTIGLKWVLH